MATTKKPTKEKSAVKTAAKAAKCAKPEMAQSASADGGTTRVKVKIPKAAERTIKQVAKDYGVDFVAATNLMLTVSMMRTGIVSLSEYAQGVKMLVTKYSVPKDKIPAYIRGGDPEDVKRFKALCAKNATLAKTDPAAATKVISGAIKAIARGKMSVVKDPSAKKAKAKKAAKK